MPEVTVLLPVYNGAAYVQKAIDSILAQTFEDFELVIIDDGSTDATPSILGVVADDRIRLVRHARNQGLTYSLIEGIGLATAALIARHDADDLSHPQRLQRQMTFLAAHPEVAVLGSQARMVDGRGHDLGRVCRALTYPSILWTQLFDNAFLHSSVVVRRSALAAVGGYDRDFSIAEDYDLWSRIALAGPVANLDEPLITFRRHAASVTQSEATRQTSLDENRRVIGRNVRALLGDGTATDAEIDLLARYRQGLASEDVRGFLGLHQRLLRRFLTVQPAARGGADFRHTLARQHLTLLRAATRQARQPGQVAGSAMAVAQSLMSPPRLLTATVREALRC